MKIKLEPQARLLSPSNLSLKCFPSCFVDLYGFVFHKMWGKLLLLQLYLQQMWVYIAISLSNATVA